MLGSLENAGRCRAFPSALPLILGSLLLPVSGEAQEAPPPEQLEITWDFETGNLMGWTRVGPGSAFNFQPTQGDNLMVRGEGPSNHQGVYWIGTSERFRDGLNVNEGATQGNEPTGILASPGFRIPGGRLSFLIGGGVTRANRVELLILDPFTNDPEPEPARIAFGHGEDTMRREVWDLADLEGRTGIIQIVDESPDDHINVDDFQFLPSNPPGIMDPGPVIVRVPNVLERPLELAEAMLREAGLVMVLAERVPSRQPPETVVAQRPEPEAEIRPGDEVEVDVAVWIEIPNVMGLDTIPAKRLLERRELRLGEITLEPSRTLPGTIIAQDPQPGREQPPGTPVHVVLAAPVEVPPLVGRDTSEARAVLAEAGLVVGVIRPEPSDRPVGSVLRQAPEPGALVPLRTPVSMDVAEGVPVPDLLGRDTLYAAGTINRAGLRLVGVTVEPSPEPTGTTVRQRPPPGLIVPLNTPVEILVAGAVPVPDVSGARLEAAEEAISEAGLTPGTAERRPSPRPMGTVVDQEPSPGAMVPLQTPVDIVLAQGVAVPDLMGSPMNDARRRVEGIGLVVDSIAQQISAADPGTVLGQTPDPGVMVPLETGVDLVVAQGVLVPDLFGQDTLAATALLDDEGLALGEVALEPSAESPGTIIRQSPPAGDPVGLETPVDVVLADPVPVPAVVDSIQEVAERAVTTQGLLLAVDRNRWSFAPTGTVLAQSPEPGALVPLETPVVVVVARHIPGGWGLPGAFLLGIFLVGGIRVRSSRKKKGDEERPPPADQPEPHDTRPPGDRPLVEVRAHTHPGEQRFESDRPPAHAAELQWRVVLDPGRPSLETAGPLIEEERILHSDPPEGDDDA